MLWTHLNRLIRERDVDTIFLAGPGHGGPAAIANAWLEGTYSEVYPQVARTRGDAELFRQFLFPGGVPAMWRPETPGSIHEGGELGYVSPTRTARRWTTPPWWSPPVVGDGEFETSCPGHVDGTPTSSWTRVRDGAVLPILHLNGYKIANPTIPARIPREELECLLQGLRAQCADRRGRRPRRRAPAAGSRTSAECSCQLLVPSAGSSPSTVSTLCPSPWSRRSSSSRGMRAGMVGLAIL